MYIFKHKTYYELLLLIPQNFESFSVQCAKYFWNANLTSQLLTDPVLRQAF